MTTTATKTLVRTMPRSGRPRTHYGTQNGRNVKLACTGRTVFGFVPDAGTAHGARIIEQGVTCRSCQGVRRESIRDEAPLLHPSLLSARDRATMHPEAQIQKLIRIGRRAMCHAEWIEELIDAAPELYVGDRGEAARVDVLASQAKASAVAEEILRIARTHNIRPDIVRRFQ